MAQFIVKGQVIDGDENLPMPQARVEVVGTDRFTTTDKNGKFEMLVSKGERLKFRFVGYIEKVVHIKRNEFLRVTLNPDCTSEASMGMTMFPQGESWDDVRFVRGPRLMRRQHPIRVQNTLKN